VNFLLSLFLVPFSALSFLSIAEGGVSLSPPGRTVVVLEKTPKSPVEVRGDERKNIWEAIEKLLDYQKLPCRYISGEGSSRLFDVNTTADILDSSYFSISSLRIYEGSLEGYEQFQGYRTLQIVDALGFSKKSDIRDQLVISTRLDSDQNEILDKVYFAKESIKIFSKPKGLVSEGLEEEIEDKYFLRGYLCEKVSQENASSPN